MDKFQTIFEEIKVAGNDLLAKVKSLIEEGNIRRLIIKDDKGNTFIEIPLTVAAIGVIAAPVLAAIGALSALVANFTIVVERSKAEETKQAPEDLKS
ncbi:MAG: hypothetical protein JWO80_1706 [Bryobacterales bacterium]|nr:hypothetical protein [Bryobacterales bacterium]